MARVAMACKRDDDWRYQVLVTKLMTDTGLSEIEIELRISLMMNPEPFWFRAPQPWAS